MSRRFSTYFQPTRVTQDLQRGSWILSAIVCGMVAVGCSQRGDVSESVSATPDRAATQETTDAVSRASSVTSLASADWPNLFGPDHNSVSSEHHLILDWPAAGPQCKWRIE